ncbi:hypothetical protein [Candidatus Hecatella orcuttiae]|jgi:hypothetical protein|uniref:hypothetical protein n=1 Tax=Candidatus Hecatella orcuttiae TaxID=1935119 RepID=UPI002867C6DD|nr:hypothetical protein [Candidatus Hecatella orcuttiae]
MGGGEGEIIPRLAAVGLALSAAGAALDFTSGTLMLQRTFMPTMPGMGMGMRMAAFPAYAAWWAFLLYALGSLLIVTGILGATRMSMGRMHVFGALMATYGVIMLAVGALMLSGVTPMMQGAVFSGLGMLAVGAGMTVNGLLMVASQKVMKPST